MLSQGVLNKATFVEIEPSRLPTTYNPNLLSLSPPLDPGPTTSTTSATDPRTYLLYRSPPLP